MVRRNDEEPKLQPPPWRSSAGDAEENDRLAEVLAIKPPQLSKRAIRINKRVAREQFATVVMKAKEHDFVINNHSRPEAALISIDRFAILDWLSEINLAEEFQKMSSERLTREQVAQRISEACRQPS
jgi:prevent-host-death family protein